MGSTHKEHRGQNPSGPRKNAYIAVDNSVYTEMATTQVQVRIPEKLVKELDRWIAEGRFSSRSEAVKTIIVLYDDRERTRKSYSLLQEESEEARTHPESLIPLKDVL